MGGRRMAMLGLVVLLGSGALPACNDDGDGDDDIVLEDIGDSPSDADGDDDAADEEGTDTETTEGIGIVGEECAELTAAFEGLGESIGAGFGDLEGDAFDDFSEAVDDAPEEIRDDLQVFADGFQAYADALEEAGIDVNDPSSIDPEAAAALGELAEIFSDPAFLEANQAIQEFVAAGCET